MGDFNIRVCCSFLPLVNTLSSISPGEMTTESQVAIATGQETDLISQQERAIAFVGSSGWL